MAARTLVGALRPLASVVDDVELVVAELGHAPHGLRCGLQHPAQHLAILRDGFHHMPG